MRTSLLKNLTCSLILFSAAFVQTTLSYAGGCRLNEVSPSKTIVSQFMASQIREQLIAIENEMAKRGEKLDVVLVARSGESLANFDVVKDNLNQSIDERLDYVAKIRKAERRARQDGHKIQTPTYLSAQKLEYSHFGYFVKKHRSDSQASDWIFMIHLLAECDAKSNRYGNSEIFFQTFDQFFWDTQIVNKKEMKNKALIVVPRPDIQQRLVHLLEDKQIADQGLHEPTYNVAATAFQKNDQNSNQWPLEIFAAATRTYGEVRNREHAQQVLFETNYRPSLVVPRGLKEKMACGLRKGPLGLWDATNLINCKDQVHKKDGLFQLITVTSMVDYMKRNNFLASNVYDPSQPGVYELSAPVEKLKELEKAGQLFEAEQKRSRR